MKKFLVFFMVLTLATGFVMAQEEDEGIGLTVGAEFGIGDINKPNNADDMYPYVMPMIIYENAFMDGALDIFAELDYTLGFTDNAAGDLPMELYNDIIIGYNLGLSEASTLSFIVEHELTFDLVTDGDVADNMLNTVRPGIRFNQFIESAGDLYAQVNLPVTYMDNGADDTITGLDFIIGWGSTFGLGLEATIYTLLSPDTVSGYNGFDVLVSYENGPVYCEVEACIPEDMDSGVTITPEFQYEIIPNLKAYVNCAFTAIGSDFDVGITPALGITYSF